MEIDDVEGWLYDIVDECGEEYTLFVYHDGSMYQVKVVYPEVEGQYDPHHGHLYPDGTICLSDEGGVSKLEYAYAKSVLWANGFTIFLQTEEFPFSLNNLEEGDEEDEEDENDDDEGSEDEDDYEDYDDEEDDDEEDDDDDYR